MPRRVQDIVPANKRSIRDISLKKDDAPIKIKKPAPKQSKVEEEEIDEVKTVEEAPVEKEIPVRRYPITPPPPKKADRKGGKRKTLLFAIFLGIVLVIAGIGYIASSYFSRATFTIVPKNIPLNINGTFVAQGTPANGVLAYEIATIKGAASTTVVAVDGPAQSTKATGKLTLVNSHSSSPQRLIAGTRLSTNSGLVYRLTSSVSVPGYTTVGGKITSGKLVTTVTADQPGANYNITKSDAPGIFHIVAYKGSDKYEKIYGEINTDIVGGFVGVKKTVAPATLASTTQSLREKMIASLTTQIKNSLPPEYIMYDGAYSTSFSAPQVGGGAKNQAVVTVSGTVYGIFFKKQDLVNKIAGDKAATFGTYAYEAPGLESLEFAITNAKDFSVDKKNNLIIRLKGDMQLIGIIPEEEIKAKLAGVPLSRTQEILKPYAPIIKTGSGELVPPWSRVPSDLSRIKMVISKPE